MFVRAFTLVLAIAASAIAAPGGATPTTTTSSDCNTGSVQCCNAVTSTEDVPASVVGLLGIIAPIGGSIATGCSPIIPIAGSGSQCTQQTVCCDNNNMNGLVDVACTPVNLNL